VTGAQDAEFDPAHWYENRNSIKKFLFEIGGYVVAVWEFRGGRERSTGALWLVGVGTRDLRNVV
jgi:hypothetical protein